MKHTFSKSPWKFKIHNNNYEIWSGNKKVAIINEAHEFPNGEQDLANADLIASAPDLLEALKVLVNEFHDWYDGQSIPYDLNEALENAHEVMAKIYKK